MQQTTSHDDGGTVIENRNPTDPPTDPSAHWMEQQARLRDVAADRYENLGQTTCARRERMQATQIRAAMDAYWRRRLLRHSLRD